MYKRQVLPHHRSDWKQAPDEEGLMEAVRAQGMAPGQYNFPHCDSPKQMNEPEFKKKVEAGPNGMLVIFSQDRLHIGRSMAISVAYNLVVSILVAYVATTALGYGTDGTKVFRLTAVVATLSYSAALGWNAIWFGRSWSSTFKEMLDGLVYGLATGALFALMWPGAADS